MPSPDVVMEGEDSFGGEPPDARARNAGGLYLPPNLSSACNSLALFRSIRIDLRERNGETNLLANAAEGAGGGVFPLGGTLE